MPACVSLQLNEKWKPIVIKYSSMNNLSDHKFVNKVLLHIIMLKNMRKI